MLRNYFKTAIRSLTKSKLFSFINIFGLAIGLGAFLLIFQFVRFEQSFDDFHTNADQIYRVQFERIYADRHDKSAGLTAGTGPALKEQFPEIEAYSKIHAAGYMTNTVEAQNNRFIEKDIFYADDGFFDLFSFGLVHGNRDLALEQPNSIVISERKALSYFGKTDVIGETLKLENGWGEQPCQVTGVFKDLPVNTHFKFDVLVSFETLAKQSEGGANTSTGWNAFPTYLKLADGVNYKNLEAKFPAFAETNYERIIDRGVQPVLLLQPLKDIYLNSNLRFEVGPIGNKKVVNILTGISVFILILAYFNYINLTTSKSLERAKEIGVRKVVGAGRSSLITQFLSESFLLNLLGITLGFTLMQLTMPFFETSVGKSFGELSILSTEFIIMIGSLLTVGTLLSGFYPAWVMSKMRATKVLKGGRTSSGTDTMVRKGLVILQFIILCFLLVGSLVVRSQIDYMLTSDTGFDSEQIIVVNGPASSNNGKNLMNSFKTDLMSEPEIIQISNTTMIPGGEITWVNNNVSLVSPENNAVVSLPFLGIDDSYVKNLSLKVIAGRNFDLNIKSDTAAVMLSRASLEYFGFEDPNDALGAKISEGSSDFLIVGVVENFIQGSFKTGYSPIIYRYVPEANNFLIIKTNSSEYAEVIASLESKYKSLYPNDTFNYFFLDEFFQRQFEEDRIFGKVFNFFTILGICISCLGLFGLVSYSVSLRKKEIGVRKILGASSRSVVILIARNFTYLILIAILVAVPIAYYATDLWLSGYTFATDMRLYMFLLPIIVVLAITLLTTGTLAFKTANSNPVNALRQD